MAVRTKLNELVGYLDSLDAKVDLAVVAKLLRALDGITCDDLQSHVHFKPECYSRNEISRGAWYELLALCWGPGQSSPIHDHKDASCGVRVVQGTLTEIRYRHDQDGVLRESSTGRLHEGLVCAAQDDDIHALANTSGTENLVTLHIYSKPLTRFHKYTADSKESTLVNLSDYYGSCVAHTVQHPCD